MGFQAAHFLPAPVTGSAFQLDFWHFSSRCHYLGSLLIQKPNRQIQPDGEIPCECDSGSPIRRTARIKTNRGLRRENICPRRLAALVHQPSPRLVMLYVSPGDMIRQDMARLVDHQVLTISV